MLKEICVLNLVYRIFLNIATDSKSRLSKDISPYAIASGRHSWSDKATTLVDVWLQLICFRNPNQFIMPILVEGEIPDFDVESDSDRGEWGLVAPEEAELIFRPAASAKARSIFGQAASAKEDATVELSPAKSFWNKINRERWDLLLSTGIGIYGKRMVCGKLPHTLTY